MASASDHRPPFVTAPIVDMGITIGDAALLYGQHRYQKRATDKRLMRQGEDGDGEDEVSEGGGVHMPISFTTVAQTAVYAYGPGWKPSTADACKIITERFGPDALRHPGGVRYAAAEYNA